MRLLKSCRQHEFSTYPDHPNHREGSAHRSTADENPRDQGAEVRESTYILSLVPSQGRESTKITESLLQVASNCWSPCLITTARIQQVLDSPGVGTVIRSFGKPGAAQQS